MIVKPFWVTICVLTGTLLVGAPLLMRQGLQRPAQDVILGQRPGLTAADVRAYAAAVGCPQVDIASGDYLRASLLRIRACQKHARSPLAEP